MCRLLTKYNEIILPFWLLLFAIKYLFGLSDTYSILMLFFGVFVFIMQPMSMKNFVPLDWAITFFSIINATLSFSGGLTASSLSEAAFFSLCLAAYFAIKQKEFQHIQIFLAIFFSISALALVVAIISFYIFRSNIFNVGFTDIYDFRFLYRPLGFTCNFWAENVVVLTALSLYLKKCRYIFLTLSIWATLLTFSRGAYIAITVLTVGFLLIEKSKIERKKYLISVFVALIITSFFCHEELLKTLSFNTQTVQQQSTIWRLESVDSDFEVFRDVLKIN